MKNFNKKIALIAALACAGTMLAGCNSNTTSDDSNSGNDTPANDGGNSSSDGDSGNADAGSNAGGGDYEAAKTAGTGTLTLPEGEGKVFNIYCWNSDFKNYVEKYYTAPAGVTFNWIEVANEGGAYQTALDQALMNQESASADDKVDLFLAEADYILKYANTDLTQDVTKLGVQNWGVGYDYTYDAATSTSGVLKGVSWQANPSVFIYRRSIAKDVLGTDDPAEVQAALSTWDKVDEVAAQAKDKGYVMFPSPLETYRSFANNSNVSYLSGDKFALTPAFNSWIEQAEKYVENGWATAYGLWDDEKQAQMGTDGKMFACVGPAWYFNFCMGTAQEQTNGDWAICVGPSEHFWGGTWLLAATGSDNEAVIADLMNAFTVNEDIMDKILSDALEFPNNKNVVNKYANDASYGLDFLGGQNHIAMMAQCAEKITWDPSLHTQYDQTFNESLPNAYLEYLKGICDKDTALSNFYITLSEVAPQITHD
ncbi:MAG: carbohydrate ABC transporter substrate-binding protein [Oscillospiraceae bacterium]|nr:carbohydrate ABC transporter substrate-binding protein [Oscillospiraceae bacterium]